MVIFAIDPGNVYSAFAVVGDDYTIYYKEKCKNDELLEWIKTFKVDRVVIERVASYGMPVGREVFDTCEWIGRFTQVSMDLSLPVEYIFRSEEKMAICHKETLCRKEYLP